MTLNELADKLDSAMKRFGLLEPDHIGMNRHPIHNKDMWKDFIHRKESPYIHLYGMYIYTVDDESFDMEIHDIISHDIRFYHRRVPSTIIELFVREAFDMAMFAYINDGDFDHE
jgi:hypothetical protein